MDSRTPPDSEREVIPTTSYKGREVPMGQRVAVYRNLHARHGKWSIKSLETGLVHAHADYIRILDAVLVVSQAGRRRAQRLQQRNVHAFVVGTLDAVSFSEDFGSDDAPQLRYRPFSGPGFTLDGLALSPDAVLPQVCFRADGSARVLSRYHGLLELELRGLCGATA